MKLEAEIKDSVLLSAPDGKASAARLAVIRFQARVRGPWKTVNVIVESDDVAVVLRAAAAHLARGTK